MKKIILFLSLLILISCKIKPAKTEEMVMDVQNGKAIDKALIQLYSWNNSDAQKWKIEKLEGQGNYYIILSKLDSKKVFDLDFGDNPGTNLQLYTWNNTDSQKWLLIPLGDNYFYILSKRSGYYLDVNQGKMEDWTKVHQWEESNSSSQIWKINPLENGYVKIICAKSLNYKQKKINSGINIFHQKK